MNVTSMELWQRFFAQVGNINLQNEEVQDVERVEHSTMFVVYFCSGKKYIVDIGWLTENVRYAFESAYELWDEENFNRFQMADYLTIDADESDWGMDGVRSDYEIACDENL